MVVLVGAAAPAAAMLVLADSPAAALPSAAGAVLALGLMGSGMIAAAVSGRIGVGVGCALLTGAGLVLLLRALAGTGAPSGVLPAGFAAMVAATSFAARGALFARSAAERGWWIALAVVGGEAAMVATAAIRPEAVPDWLLALLPAQWASTAIGFALGGAGIPAAGTVLLALAGTAATTLLVAALWPRRWPYLVMFSAWLALSALVYLDPALPSSAMPPQATG